MPEITASNNPFPSILVEETASASVPTPSAGQQRIFIDTSDHHKKRKNSSGTVTDLENFGNVSTTGSPATGNLAKFSAAATVTNGDLSGDVTTSGTLAATIANDAVTNAKMANMAQSTIKGRAVSAGTGDPTDLTATQATAILDAMVGDSGSGGTKGLVPAPASGDTAAGKFLKADGTWSAPSGTGAPSSAQYVCLATDSGLSAERVLTAGTGISITDGGANGNVTIAVTGGSAGFVLLEQHTASTSASLDFTTFYSSTYDDYEFRLLNVLPSTDDVRLDMQVSHDGGSTWDTASSSYFYTAQWVTGTPTSGVFNDGSSGFSSTVAALADHIDTGGGAGLVGVTGTVRWANPGQSSAKHKYNVEVGYYNNSNLMQGIRIYGWSTSTSAINAVRFLASSGNLASGTIRAYGISK